MSANDGGPAFPCEVVNRPEPAAMEPGVLYPLTERKVSGMSLRDYLASAIINGLLCNAEFTRATLGLRGPERAQVTAREAYSMADAMLAERAK